MHSGHPNRLTRAAWLTGMASAIGATVAEPLRAKAYAGQLACGCSENPLCVRMMPSNYSPVAAPDLTHEDLAAVPHSLTGALLTEHALRIVSNSTSQQAALRSGILTLRLVRGRDRYVGPFCAVVGDKVVPTREGYSALQYMLRDVRGGGLQHAIDLRLGVLLSSLSTSLNDAVIGITDGYRTPQTNRHTDRAAQNSRHMYGEAIDGYVDGYSYETVFLAAAGCPFAGGLGLYRDHVHLDTWKYATW